MNRLRHDIDSRRLGLPRECLPAKDFAARNDCGPAAMQPSAALPHFGASNWPFPSIAPLSSNAGINPTAANNSNLNGDQVKWPLFKMSNFGVWKGPELGRGYSGVVHQGVGVLWDDDEADVREAKPMALKLSRPKQINLNHTAFGTPGREFETLRYLFVNSVPVPRPLGFCLNLDDQGCGRTLLVMDVVDGWTLRDWINRKTEAMYRHNATGRTIHPANNIEAAVDRIDVAVTLIEALLKLHEFGTFVDFKPRNIMVGQKKVLLPYRGDWCRSGNPSEDLPIPLVCSRYAFPITLVDIGGVVLRTDLLEEESPDLDYRSLLCSVAASPITPQSSPDVRSSRSGGPSRPAAPGFYGFHSLTPDEERGFRAPPNGGNEWPELNFMPLRHRHLLETTCSYISPELAVIVTESDRLKGCLENHFQPSIVERFAFYNADQAAKRIARCAKRSKGDARRKFTRAEAVVLPEKSNLIEISNEKLTSTGSSESLPWAVNALRCCHSGENSLVAEQAEPQNVISGENSCVGGPVDLLGSNLRTAVKAHLLQESYEETLRLLARERVILQSPSDPLENAIVKVGQKSSVYSFGLILGELFGGLRTGLSALCSVPIINQWFSKEYAYDAFHKDCEDERQAQRRQVLLWQQKQLQAHEQRRQREQRDIRLCRRHGRCREPQIGIAQSGTTSDENAENQGPRRSKKKGSVDAAAASVVPLSSCTTSVSSFSGRSQRRADSEFRMTLEWEHPRIPYSLCPLSNGTAAASIDVSHVRQAYDPFVDPADVVQVSCETSGRRRRGWAKVGEEKDDMSFEDEVVKASPLFTSFKELYREYCYPREGCFSRHWQKQMQTENGRVVVLFLGTAVERLLDDCLSLDPHKRPGLTKLKRMLLGFRLVFAALKDGSMQACFTLHSRSVTEQLRGRGKSGSAPDGLMRWELRMSFDGYGYAQVDSVLDLAPTEKATLLPPDAVKPRRVTIPLAYAFSRASDARFSSCATPPAAHAPVATPMPEDKAVSPVVESLELFLIYNSAPKLPAARR